MSAIPEIQPEFRYDTCTSTISSLERYFRENFIMSPVLEGYNGKIIVEIIIEKSGQVSDVKVLRGSESYLDVYVCDSIKKMPKWIPAKTKGRNVKSGFVIPVNINWLYGEN